MELGLSILYRGSLASCNYGCWYCPFAKQVDSPEELAHDRAALRRFSDWVEAADFPVSMLFTPWGEALVRKHYRETMIAFSHLPHVRRVAAQTNLAYRLDWLDACNRETLALWCTFHPSETTLDRFVARCEKLDTMGIRYSVGTVGILDQIDAIEELRSRISPEVYVWVNAFKREPDYYRPEDVARLESVDPLFRLNRNYPSQGRACQTGESVISVSHDGSIRRCHFIPEVLGNIYDDDLRELLRPRPCSADQCGCHIGFVHLEELGLGDIYGRGVLERIPENLIWPQTADRIRAQEYVVQTLHREQTV